MAEAHSAKSSAGAFELDRCAFCRITLNSGRADFPFFGFCSNRLPVEIEIGVMMMVVMMMVMTGVNHHDNLRRRRKRQCEARDEN